MNLAGDQIKDTYGALLNIGASGALSTLQPVTDGFGNVLPFEVSTTTFNFTGTVTGGPIGPTGAAGTSGTSGTSGVSGSSGTSGTDGTSGTSGIDGTSGTSGISGSSGTSGISGSSGTSGTSGVSGSSGTSGTDGTSGTSGINGATGPAGPGASSPITVEQTNSLVSTGVGATAGAGSNCAVVIGNNACTVAGVGSESVVIGCGAKHYAYGSNSIIIGPGSSSTNIGIVSIGYLASGDAQNGVNIGTLSCTVCNGGVGSIAIGCRSFAYGLVDQPDIAIGACTVSRFGGMAIGSLGTFSCETKGIAIGLTSKVFPGATGAIVLGNSSVGGTGSNNSIVIGNSSQASEGAYNAIAIGATATALAPNQIAIGTGIRTTCTNTGQNKIAIGFGIEQSANFNSNNTIEIGCHAAGASPLDGAGIILGFGNNPQYGANSVTIGFSNARHSGDSITLGRNNCGWDNSVIVGNVNCTNAGSGTLLVFGCSNQINNGGGTIFGRGNCTLAGNEVILGNCNADYNGGGGNDMVIIGNSNSTNTVAFFHGLVAGNGNSASSIAWQSCDHSIIGQYNSKVGDGTAYCHSLVIGSNNCVPGNPGNCTNVVGHYNKLFTGATGSTVIGNNSVGATGAIDSIVIGNSACVTANCATAIGCCSTASHACSVVLGPGLTSVGTNRTHMRQPNVSTSNIPGPYADDTAYYAGFTGGTAGDFYIFDTGSHCVLTIAGFNP